MKPMLWIMLLSLKKELDSEVPAQNAIELKGESKKITWTDRLNLEQLNLAGRSVQ
jgi:hypothetical protein